MSIGGGGSYVDPPVTVIGGVVVPRLVAWPVGARVTAGDTVPGAQLSGTQLSFGSGIAAHDVALLRPLANVLELSNGGAGSGFLRPHTDAAGGLGMSGAGNTIWGSIHAAAIAIRTAAADANPSVLVGVGSIQLGAGGATALDTTLSRSAASTIRATVNAFNIQTSGGAGITFNQGSGTAWQVVATGTTTRLVFNTLLPRVSAGTGGWQVVTGIDDANPMAELASTALSFGAGGATAVDWTMIRTTANRMDMGSGDSLDALGTGAFENRSGSGDANPRMSLTNDTLAFGAGGAVATDVSVNRSGTSALRATATTIFTNGRRRKLTITPAQLTANQDNYAGVDGAEIGILSTNGGAFNITGITAGLDGDELELINNNGVGGATITLVHDATSTAANRFYLSGSVNLGLLARSRVTFRYIGALSRWVQWTPMVSA